MILVGLTGSIGMGKSTAAAALRRLGIPVLDSDRTVHGLLAPGGGAVGAVLAAFPGVSDGEGGIDRRRLGRIVFADPAALRRLERILHPRVRAAERRFRAALQRRRVPLAVLDVPLLYETGGDRRCDAILVVSAPAFLQRRRVLARPGMTPARLAATLAQQMPDREKRRRTPYVIPTGLGQRPMLSALRRSLRRIKSDIGRRRSRAAGHRPFRRRGRRDDARR